MIKGDYSSIKLIDFGMAAFDENDQAKVRGTPNFMSPEMIIGKNYGIESDMWSLGVILHYCATSKLPFNAGNLEELSDLLHPDGEETIKNGKIEKVVSYDFPALSSKTVSKSLRDFIKKILVYNPKNRISINDAFQHEFIKQLDDVKGESNKDNIDKVIDNILKFSTMNIFQKYVYLYLAKICKTEKENKTEKVLFDVFDNKLSGSINKSDFFNTMSKYKPKYENSLLLEVWDNLDYNKSGIIQYSEFLAASLLFLEYLNEEKMESAFNYYTRDNQKNINIETFVETLLSLNIKVNDDEVTKFFKGVKDEQLTYEDFKNMINNR